MTVPKPPAHATVQERLAYELYRLDHPHDGLSPDGSAAIAAAMWPVGTRYMAKAGVAVEQLRPVKTRTVPVVLSAAADAVRGRAGRSTTLRPAPVAACSVCGFDLWLPIAGLAASQVGLVSDTRFPGRCLVSLRQHFERLEDVPPPLLSAFMGEVQAVSAVLRQVTASARANVAFIDDGSHHVFAHVIPRFPDTEPLPRQAPWEHPQPRTPLLPAWEARVMGGIRDGLAASLPIAMPVPARIEQPQTAASGVLATQLGR